MPVRFVNTREAALQDQALQQMQSGFDTMAKDKENKRARALQGLDLVQRLSEKYNVAPEQKQRVIDAYSTGDVGNITQVLGEIDRPENYKPEYAKQREREENKYNLEMQKLQAEVNEYGKPFEESKKGREFRAQREIVKEIEAPAKQWEKKKYLIDKKDKIVTQYKDLDRVFGNVDSLAAGYTKAKMTGRPMSAADQFQLIRSFVPLSEVNPGVVREAEFDTARALSGKLQGYAAQLENVREGKLLPESAIEDMIASAKKLKDVIERGKQAAYQDLSDEAESEGFKGKDKEIVLGNIGRGVLGKKQSHNDALEWARKNPNDTRAIAILKAHGAY